MGRWYNYTVECRCCGKATEEVVKAVNKLNKRNAYIGRLFERVELAKKSGKYYQIDEVYGDNNNKAFTVFHNRSYGAVKAKLNGMYMPKSVFSNMVAIDRKERMDAANKLRFEFCSNVKEIKALWNERTIEEGVTGEEGRLQCPLCHSQDVKIIGLARTWHCGVTKDDLKKEAKAYGFKDIKVEDPSITEDEVIYHDILTEHEAEAEFYDLVATGLPASKVISKLDKKYGMVIMLYLSPIIAEYLSYKL